MEPVTVIGIITGITLLIWLILRPRGCDHAEKTYYDLDGEELLGDQSEACFTTCNQCGETFVIPSGFQSDAHFESFLLYGGGPKK